MPHFSRFHAKSKQPTASPKPVQTGAAEKRDALAGHSRL